MASLRERLAAVSSARRPPSDARSRDLPTLSSLRRAGVSVREEICPLKRRRWLRELWTADPRGAQLISNLKSEVSDVSDWLFLDLETTGLAGGTGTYAFLIGLGRITREGFQLRQYFLGDLASERELLTALAPELEAAPLLVTYNGKLFDAPLLETRYRLARMRWPLEERPHLDLLFPARRLWKLRCGSARLLDLEQQVLRHERGEDVPGALIPQLYFDYLRCGDARPLDVVFQHNADDLLTLAALAARLLTLAAAPETTHDDGLELFGLARLFERAREPERAATLYECALRDHLPEEASRAAKLRLSFLYKRRGDYESAAALWRALSEGPADRTNLIALEQLAVCYEHRLGDPAAAARVARQALELGGEWRERFVHRLQRLARKTAPLVMLPVPSAVEGSEAEHPSDAYRGSEAEILRFAQNDRSSY